ncbi:MAG: YitT family protein, partial [Treponema sp.]|nr:YitT family protein [Treponema sp.]
MSKDSSVLFTVKRISFVLIGALLMAFNINTFVHAGGLIPGGFTGLTLLIQEIALRYGNIRLPFSLINFTLNAVPAIVCFRYIGKHFTIYSCLMILVCGFL